MRSIQRDLMCSTALMGWHGVGRTGIIEGLILTALTSAGVTGAALSVGTTLLAGVAGIALSSGLSFLAQSLFRPAAPRPEDVQQSFRQATAPRVRHYGRVKASGPLAFLESSQGDLYKIATLGQGPVDAIEQFWIDDKRVFLDGSSFVTTAPWATKVAIQYRLGEASQTAYGFVNTRFPQWTADHRGNGVASLAIRQLPVPDSDFLSMFPRGVETNYRVVMRAAKLVPFGGGAPAWGDNAAAVIYDYMRHADGMRLPASVLDTPLALAGWNAAFARANENVPLAAGGSEKRYRLWGSYQLNERPADVLGRMLQSCDGRLIPTPDGGLTLDIGTWEEPTVIIGPETITGWSGLKRGREVLTTANTIRATYLEPSQDYQAAEADPWVDEVDVGERGEIAADVQFNMAPSHGQARRLMKLAAWRANPSWVGTFQCNLRAMAAIARRFVRIQLPVYGINSVFEVQDFRFNIGEGGMLAGVTLSVQSMPGVAYDWDPSQEGTAPVYDETVVDDALPIPAAPTLDFAGGAATLSFSPSPSPILFYRARYKKTAGSTWTTSGNLENDATTFITSMLDDDTEYEFQLAFRTEKGRMGSWSASTVATTPV